MVRSRSLATEVTEGLEALVGNYFDPSLGGLQKDRLADNSDSAKGKVRFYTEFPHCWPPLDNFLAGIQVYYPLQIPSVHCYIIS